MPERGRPKLLVGMPAPVRFSEVAVRKAVDPLGALEELAGRALTLVDFWDAQVRASETDPQGLAVAHDQLRRALSEAAKITEAFGKYGLDKYRQQERQAVGRLVAELVVVLISRFVEDPGQRALASEFAKRQLLALSEAS